MSDVSGCGFIWSGAGLFKLLILLFGGATWGLYIASDGYKTTPIKLYVLIAFIISWAITFILYILKMTGLNIQLQSECLTFDAFDYFWSWLSCMNYLVSSVLIACFFDRADPLCRDRGARGFCKAAMQLTVILLGLVTAIFYAVEARHLKPYAPAGAGYGTTWRGIWKSIILIFGGMAFGLLIVTGYRCGNGCTEARTFTLIAWCVAWGVAALMYIIRILNCNAKIPANRQSGFGAFEFFWSVIACLLYLAGAGVYAGFMKCSSFRHYRCRQILAACVCGFVTGLLFLVDACILRENRPAGFVRKRRVQQSSSSGGRSGTVTTTTTERQVTRA